MLDPDTLQKFQEELRKQAQESWELRGGHSIKELLRDVRRVRTLKPPLR